MGESPPPRLAGDYPRPVTISRGTAENSGENRGRLPQPTPSLAGLISDLSSSPFPNQIDLAWSASLMLVAIALVLTLTAQFLYSRSGHH
jgi:hypothetical protein